MAYCLDYFECTNSLLAILRVSVFKFVSLLESSFIAAYIRLATRFELWGVLTIAGAIGKLAIGFDDKGASAAVVVELGVSTAGWGVPSLGMLTSNGWTLAVLLGLGFPWVLRWDMILKINTNDKKIFHF